jgi:hypothetical protein
MGVICASFLPLLGTLIDFVSPGKSPIAFSGSSVGDFYGFVKLWEDKSAFA